MIGSGYIPKPSGGLQIADRNVGFTHNLLLAVKGKQVGIGRKVNIDRIGHQSHADVGRNNLVINVVLFVGLVLLHS